MNLMIAVILVISWHNTYSQQTAVPYPDQELFGSKHDLTYTGQQLYMLQMPVGGIGTGNILLGGRGQIEYLELFNRPNRTERAEHSFFSIWIKEKNKDPLARILERKYLPPYPENSLKQLRGIRRFDEVRFSNHFPFADLEFFDDEVPLKVKLECYSPFIPLDPDNSGFPLVHFNWLLENPTSGDIETVIAFSLSNPVKYTAEGNKRNGGNLNKRFKNDEFEGIVMTNTHNNPNDYAYAEVLMGSPIPSDDWQTKWYHGSYGIGQIAYWYQFSNQGKLFNEKTEAPSAEGLTDVATVTVRVSLKPGEKATIPFFLSWYVPNRRTTPSEALGQMEAVNKPFKNYYATQFTGAADVVRKYMGRQQYFYIASRKFNELIAGSSYPSYVKDALLSQTASIRSPLIHRMENGDTHGFEGVLNNGWCCPGTCTHVWNYEQSLAFLFPQLERTMRNVSFLHDTHPNGFQVFRSVFPLGTYWFDGPSAADGQFGNIIRVYREWKYSGDTEWLKSIWPKVKLALEFAWKGPGVVNDPKLKYQERAAVWDAAKKGILYGEQHNTYDINFYGPSSMTSSLYIAALKACAEMASALNENNKAREYENIFQSGLKEMEKLLWNGRYYIQIIEEEKNKKENADYSLSPPDINGKVIPRYQYGNGCLSDQLLGQFLAHVSGLGYVFPKARADSAIAAVFRHNFKPDVSTVDMVQRTYAYNNEAGLLLCSWPDNDRPVMPFVYSDEIWTGVEYQVAASLIYSGFVKEGLTVTKAVRDRYDGAKRNPFAEDESGVHYARAMASWSLLTALSGYSYDGIAQSLYFSPKVNDPAFRTFWSTGTAWGELQYQDRSISLKTESGRQTLKTLSLKQLTAGSNKPTVMINRKRVPAALSLEDNHFKVRFSKAITLNSGDVLDLVF